MDLWKFFDVVHRDHLICNPTSEAKIRELVERLGPLDGGSVLEVAAGKGEVVTELVERWGLEAVALDLSPHFCRDLRQRLAGRVPGARVTVLEMDGAAYQPDAPGSFDLTLCLGASWIFGGHEGTLRALERWTRPGGQIVVGEPHWRSGPPTELPPGVDYTAETFGTLWDNVEAGRRLGLRLTYVIDSSLDDWDRYYALWWRAADRFALEHPDDPDLAEIRARIEKQQEEYLRLERAALGWSILVFRKP